MKVKVLALLGVLLLLSTPTAFAQDCCYADLDCDTDVDGTDAYLFKVQFGLSLCPGLPECDCPAPIAYCDEDPYEPVWKIFQEGTDESVEWVTHAPNPRFAIYDNETPGDENDDLVLDKDTGLIWARKGNFYTEMIVWQDAIDYCRNLALGNRKGWRLPTAEELATLIDPSQSPPRPSGHPFVGLATSYYWSSTTDIVNSQWAWGVTFWSGGNGNVYARLKTGLNGYVLPVFGSNGYATGDW